MGKRALSVSRAVYTRTELKEFPGTVMKIRSAQHNKLPLLPSCLVSHSTFMFSKGRLLELKVPSPASDRRSGPGQEGGLSLPVLPGDRAGAGSLESG